MKKVFTYLTIYFISALIFYGGSGINIASFCCDTCQSKGITGIVKGVCCDIHCHDSKDADHPETDTDSFSGTHETHCSLSRIMHDWNSSNIPTFKCEPDDYELIKVCLPDDLTVSYQVVNDLYYECSTGPPSVCPRVYLSLLTTLLI